LGALIPLGHSSSPYPGRFPPLRKRDIGTFVTPLRSYSRFLIPPTYAVTPSPVTRPKLFLCSSWFSGCLWYVTPCLFSFLEIVLRSYQSIISATFCSTRFLFLSPLAPLYKKRPARLPGGFFSLPQVPFLSLPPSASPLSKFS